MHEGMEERGMACLGERRKFRMGRRGREVGVQSSIFLVFEEDAAHLPSRAPPAARVTS